MSREERKMAQIIASIERMEQETRDGAEAPGRSQEPHDAARQGGRGKKGKKNKYSGMKAKAGRKLKVVAGAGGAKGPFERKLTPKKRWIQLWSAQLDTIKEKDASSSEEGPEKEEEETETAAVSAVSTSPMSAGQVTPAAPPALVVAAEKQEMPTISDKPVPSRVPPVPTEKDIKSAPASAPVSVAETNPHEETTEKQAAETFTPKSAAATTTPKTANAAAPPKASSAGGSAASSSAELRVKTPLNNESSHLSPPLERNSPTTTSSISPSGKVKDSDTPHNNTAAAAAKFSPAATEQEKPVVTEKKELPKRETVAPKLERKSSSSSSVDKGEESYRRDISDRHHDRARKRSLERSDLPMSEEAKRRAERRRKRKSNWDVGDPRKGGSPVADLPISAAAAAANQQSFAKYPPNRPPWRHSQKRPRVVGLRDLEPGRRYVVQFEADEPTETATALFHTAREENGEATGEVWTDRVVVVSCDRYVDDHDDVLMERLASDVEAHDDAVGASSVHFGMAHLGDQIYADAGESSIKVVPFPAKEMEDPKQKRARFEAVLAQFRAIYRETFGRKVAQRVLRIGAHWMLPDDHEIINNFNHELIQKAFKGPQNSLLSEEERERLVALQLHCRAGLQAYYEFQYQLYHEFPWDSVDFLEDSLGDIIQAYPVYFAVELQRLKLLFMDVRFERSFFDAPEDLPKLVGNDQRQFLDGKLQTWSKEDQSTVVIFASMPLFFQSAFSAAIAHVVEHETYPGMAEQRMGLEDIFQIFQGYNQQKRPGEFSPLVSLLVGGDLHMMAHSRVCGTEGPSSGCLDQLITSGITNGSTSIQDSKLIPYYYLITQLTPLFEIVNSWARYVPVLPSLLPRSSPWYIEYDRVFLGRNYGILEYTADGRFNWDQTVTEPYDDASHRRIQSVIDASTPRVLGSIVLLLALFNASMIYHFALRRCCQRSPKQAVKTTKTQ
ncbi:hypothetical protein KRP22_007615 [Phytophthora ramorum]|nr:hypothetical protein KRP22_4373 [Phytophthora ramorum]